MLILEHVKRLNEEGLQNAMPSPEERASAEAESSKPPYGEVTVMGCLRGGEATHPQPPLSRCRFSVRRGVSHHRLACSFRSSIFLFSRLSNPIVRLRSPRERSEQKKGERGRARARERESVRVCLRVRVGEREWARESERERESLRASERDRERKRASEGQEAIATRRGGG